MEKQTAHPARQNSERRVTDGSIEVRQEGDKRTLRGYAAIFGTTYDMGHYTESVNRSFFDGIKLDDVRVLFNHDSNQILGRTKSGTARVFLDEKGLAYEVDLPDSPIGENVRAAAMRGDIDQSSWGFEIGDNGSKWTTVDGKRHRELVVGRAIWDVSPVTFPANPDTTVALREMAQAEKEEVPPVASRAKDLDLTLKEIELSLQKNYHTIKK